MTVAVRFAPSPTGFLHVGNARVALVNFLFARKHQGRFVLRIDDTDRERSRPEFVDAIEQDLGWLGLAWDKEIRQSDRLALYAEALEKLKAGRRAYACYETPEELETKRRLQLAKGRPPVYDRAGLSLTDADKRKLESEGRRPHWRFLLSDARIVWDDLVHGEIGFEPDSLSDPVLIRSDGQPLYAFTSVVDDVALTISHILRGDDHIANSAAQTQMFEALGHACPRLGHLPLLTDIEGGGLSKRLGSLSLRDLRAEGVEPMALASLLARLGTSDAIEPCGDLAALWAGFDLGKFGRASPKFDPAEMMRLNARILHEMPFDVARPRLAGLGLPAADEAFWLAVRPNLEKLSDARVWWDVCRAPIAPVVTDAAFLARAADLLPAAPWGPATWREWTEAVSAATEAKGRTLYRPLRLALTGLDHGPALENLLPMIGPERARARLSGKTA
ncbi:MAG: glutamate--tRNA ligase [Alphaproteobacteria bacterium]